ncbi:MAG: hypothetical protein ABL857_06895 [Rickettsiales bacterium]|jgi:hypothetical protein
MDMVINITSLIVLVMTIVAPIVIYLDATKNYIGRIKDKKGFLNMPAGGWAGSALLITIIAVPLYVIKRKRLIDEAKNNPVYITKMNFILVSSLLVVFSILVLYNEVIWLPKNDQTASVLRK